MGNAILISIQPRFAALIFQGKKTVELRRIRPKVNPGDIALVYVSSPDMALVGAFTIKEIVSGTPRQLWPSVKDSSGITKNEYDIYYHGTDTAIALHIEAGSVRVLKHPVELGQLRREWPRFQPPQSYRYLDSILSQYNSIPDYLRGLLPQYYRRSPRLNDDRRRTRLAS